MAGYAILQLRPGRELDAGQEQIIYIISSHMDAHGMMPCGRDSAERTVRFARAGEGWAIFDDEADRLNVGALDGLGRSLTGKLRGSVHAIGVMGEGSTRMLRLYRNGRLSDTYITKPGFFGRVGRWISCRGHAVRWRGALPEDAGIGSLSDAFEHGLEDAPAGFMEIRQVLRLHDSCSYGFSALDDSGLSGIITLYFCAANHVRQRWYERLLSPLAGRRVEAGASSMRIKGEYKM